jgi:hypothetical protein
LEEKEVCSMNRLKTSVCALFATTFVSFGAAIIIPIVSVRRQHYWKGLLGEEIEQTVDVLAKKRMWVNILETWSPILWNITITLFGISVICIALYFFLKYKKRKSQHQV